MFYIVHAGGERTIADQHTLDSMCQAMAAKYGKIDRVEPSETRPNSDWGSTVVDGAAKERIEVQHAAFAASGIKVDAGEQYYATGTRMADVGYSTQTARKAEHDAKLPAREASEQLAARILAECRKEVTTTAAALARSIDVNGKVKGHGFALRERAIRGLLARLESPALGYVLGLRERIADELKNTEPNRDAVKADKEKLADVLRHECARAGETTLVLRAREALGDCFAIVSPGYEPADAPEVVSRIADDLPADARASWAYDPASTAWELRTSVWTPTPVEEQAVGEAFEGYVSFSSRDNGTGALRGGGGITLLRCLNASTYVADGRITRRRHTSGIMVDVRRILQEGSYAINAVCAAWGRARSEVIEVAPELSLEAVLPGFWTAALQSRECVLAGVLPGRTKEHAKNLTGCYFRERRDEKRLVKSDLANAWTRYIQTQPADVRREAESAAGSWVVSGMVPRLLDRATIS